jgi:hypothetical protein
MLKFVTRVNLSGALSEAPLRERRLLFAFAVTFGGFVHQHAAATGGLRSKIVCRNDSDER